jgi:tetratricopeptide (TPR) repeat protein
MNASRLKASPRTPRRWRTPPPLTRGSENLEGMDILREVGNDTGLLLWQSYRNVMLWASADAEQKAVMFSAEAGRKRLADLLAAEVPGQIVDALVVIGRLLGSPGAVTDDAVSEACLAVAGWADAHGYTGTALSFTQAAALAAPSSARLAFEVGQSARRRHELARAETWFRHAIMVGRQVGEWEAYSRSYIALGTMLMARGNFPGAQRMLVKALRASRRKGLPSVQGNALHEMFIIASETGRPAQAEEFARQAFRAYGPEHHRVPALAHDIAYFWMQHGHFARALPVFEALLPRISAQGERLSVFGAIGTPTTLVSAQGERLAVLGSIAHAAGGTGRRDLFRKVWVEATRMVKEPGVAETVAPAMMDLADGAALLGELDRAEQAAQAALRAAEERQQHKIHHRAERMLETIREGRAQRAAAADAALPEGGIGETLASDLVRSLSAV